MPATRRTLLSAAAASATALVARGAEPRTAPEDVVPLPPDPERGLLFSCKVSMVRAEGASARLAAAREAGMDGVDFDDATSVTPGSLRAAVRETGVFVHNVLTGKFWMERLTSPDAATRARGLELLRHCIRCAHAAGAGSVLLVVGKAEDGPEGTERAREEIRKAIPLAAALGQRILFENVWNGLFYEVDGPRNQSVKPFVDYIDSFASPCVGAFFDLGNHARYADVPTWIRELGPRIGKLDIKGYSNAKADREGARKGFVDIAEADIDWAAVRSALRDIGYTGWVSAEVGAGDVARLRLVLDQMRRALLG